MYTAPLLLSCVLGSCLHLRRFLVLLLVVGSSALVLAVPRVVPFFATVVAGRCFCYHGHPTTSDRHLGSVVR